MYKYTKHIKAINFLNRKTRQDLIEVSTRSKGNTPQVFKTFANINSIYLVFESLIYLEIN